MPFVPDLAPLRLCCMTTGMACCPVVPSHAVAMAGRTFCAAKAPGQARIMA
ncbi:hypothetical protein [Methylobacterium sp. 77]|uniref:hypothetical protein n=1 Tax=Methylobacterium sp. 77 TaxID=1101192 RepID=UPI0003A4D612|nr:hypothetical protein [Methylobacterium sp. 77]